MKLVHVVGFAIGLLACGCHNFTIVNGKPVEVQAADGYDERMHSAIAGDVVVVDKPVQRNTVCPQGWAQIDRKVSFENGLLNTFAGWFARGGGLYRADTITVHCAEAPSVLDATSGLRPPRKEL